ncbi:MAG: hypothetical protein ABEI06_08900 [Halobacteriaceae archaeon]
MLDQLECTCEGCDNPLEESDLQLAMKLEGGERRAYECSCGTVTITIVDPDSILGLS